MREKTWCGITDQVQYSFVILKTRNILIKYLLIRLKFSRKS